LLGEETNVGYFTGINLSTGSFETRRKNHFISANLVVMTFASIHVMLQPFFKPDKEAGGVIPLLLQAFARS